MHLHIGIPQFVVVACYIIIFAFLWRAAAVILRRQGHDSLAGAMATIL